jgi:peptidoglycan hydrolase-like protein with peptidoglycan-binding domain
VFVQPPATLRQGAKGDLVKKLQAALGVVPDGDFGPVTKTALQKFQVDHGLVGDGIAGPQTWKLISSNERKSSP